MTLTRTRLAVLATVALLVLAAVWLAVRPADGARLQWSVKAWNGSGNTTPGPVSAVWLFGGMDPCVDRGSVSVTSFAFTKSANLTVLAWGHRPNPFTTGGRMQGGTASKTLQSLGFATTPAAVSNTCADERANTTTTGWGSEFAIEVQRSTTDTGWGDGLSVTYRSAGHTHVSRWPLGFVLCGATAPPDRFTQLCR